MLRGYLVTFLITICTGVTVGLSQSIGPADLTKPMQILPPSPNAASLGKYGGVNIGLNTGTPNISIPIYEYKSANLSLPISIYYASNGIKVDEIASRVGMGWALNVGGVITRTVYGSVDEQSNRLAPKLVPSGTALLDLLNAWNGGPDGSSAVGPYGTYDNQPDIFQFNFGGYSGSFILDDTRFPDGTANMQPILLTYSNLKFERSTSPIDDYSFKCTDEEGIVYQFKSAEFTKSYTLTENSTSGCGLNYNIKIATAFYLDKIIHPNNDVITLSYTRASYHNIVSNSQTIYSNDPADANVACPDASFFYKPTRPSLDNVQCLNALETDGVRLSEISSSTGGRIAFSYIDRLDGDDKLVSKLEVFQKGNSTALKTFIFQYYYPSNGSYNVSSSARELRYRPFLMSVREIGTGTSEKKHKFNYNNFETLPFRLSYAKDHWGYFNGVNNSTLIPVPSNEDFRYYLPIATANREPNSEFAKRGILSSIVYPTGGKDSIIYEANLASQIVQVNPNTSIVSLSASADNTINPLLSTNLVVSFSQVVNLSGSKTSGPRDTLSNVNVRLLDLQGNAYFSKELSQSEFNNFGENLWLNPGTYRLELRVLGPNVTATATIGYKPGVITNVSQVKEVGGVRLQKILTYSGAENLPIIKKYRYEPSTFINRPTNYEKRLKIYTVCPSGNLEKGCVGTVYHSFFTMYSNSIYDVYQFPGGATSYGKVTEQMGENSENGEIEHNFIVEANYPASPIANMADPGIISGAPVTRFDFRNGREVSRIVSRKEGTVFKPVQKFVTHFTEDNNLTDFIRGYISNRNYIYPCPLVDGAPTEYHWQQFECATYEIYKSWVYVDEVKTLTYDNEGINYSEDIVSTEYANSSHSLPTKITRTKSNGSIQVTQNYYPHDLSLTGTEETARQALLQRHIFNPVLLSTNTVGGTQVSAQQVKYKIFPNNLVLPESKWFRLMNDANWHNVQIFYGYDLQGKLLEQGKLNDVHTSYLWGYDHNYPVAAVVGKTYSEISSYVDQAVLDNPASQATLQNELSKIRTGLINSQALVTTYAYDRMIGVTSETDVRNRSIYYEYDDLSRLKNIRDHENNILKRYHYAYADQTLLAASTLNKVIDNYRQVDLDGVRTVMRDYNYNSFTDTRQMFSNGVARLPDGHRDGPPVFYNAIQMKLRVGQFCFMEDGYSIEYRVKMPAITTDNSKNAYFITNGTASAIFTDLYGTGMDGVYLYGFWDEFGNAYGAHNGENGFGYILADPAHGFSDFQNIRLKVMRDKYEVYYNDNLVRDFPRDNSQPISTTYDWAMAFIGNDASFDWFKVYDKDDNLKYVEDFNNPSQPAMPDPSLLCPAPADCELRFAEYFNQAMGTRYSYAEINAMYMQVTGQPLNICH